MKIDGKYVEINENKEFITYNKLLDKLWRKYHYVAMQMMAKKFLKKIDKLDEDNDYFEMLPITSLQSANEYHYFSNFVLSDMRIEILRAAKLKVLTDHLLAHNHDKKSALI